MKIKPTILSTLIFTGLLVSACTSTIPQNKSTFVPYSGFAIDTIGNIQVSGSLIVFPQLGKQFEIESVNDTKVKVEPSNPFHGERIKTYTLRVVSENQQFPVCIGNPKYLSMSNTKTGTPETGICIDSISPKTGERSGCFCGVFNERNLTE